jgi:hypothetical protein
LKLLVTESPWNMAFFDADGNPVLVELPSTGDGPSGSLAMHLSPPLPGNGQCSALPPLTDGEPSTPPLAEDDWSYDEATGVLDATYTTTTGTLTVTGC